MTMAAEGTPQRRMVLGNVTRGRVKTGRRTFIYGVPKIGKSTFASEAPAPIFIPTEDGTNELDVARFPLARSWDDVLEAVRTLTREPHEYRTVVIDTVDELEQLLWTHICRREKVPSIEDVGGGYQKGYGVAVDDWRILLNLLDELRRQRGVDIILIGHATTTTFKNPEGDDFDRYEPCINRKAHRAIYGWADLFLFAHYEIFAKKTKGQAKAKGFDSGARVLETERRAAWDAGNRTQVVLPPTIPLSWEALAAELSPATLRGRIAGLLEGASEEIATRVRAATDKAGDDAAELSRIAGKLNATLQTQERS